MQRNLTPKQNNYKLLQFKITQQNRSITEFSAQRKLERTGSK
ncbi:11613_t:CDS:2 [Acaulospora morrowiae]|uniref:11613_t:CDS:1 n=1 Tax=Acaulospora morrowiae TaxID=94023 RepID=A0A9N9AJ62_9GLOM|nr:11613_t:CDS:2 [Acaulospora morrowiae]